jgi:hypothetical protein
MGIFGRLFGRHDNKKRTEHLLKKHFSLSRLSNGDLKYSGENLRVPDELQDAKSMVSFINQNCREQSIQIFGFCLVSANPLFIVIKTNTKPIAFILKSASEAGKMLPILAEELGSNRLIQYEDCMFVISS